MYQVGWWWSDNINLLILRVMIVGLSMYQICQVEALHRLPNRKLLKGFEHMLSSMLARGLRVFALFMLKQIMWN